VHYFLTNLSNCAYIIRNVIFPLNFKVLRHKIN